MHFKINDPLIKSFPAALFLTLCLIIAFIGLYGLLNLNQSKTLSGWLGFGFGLGYFGVGISWVYVSVASFGQVGAIGAAAVTFGLIALMALYWGLAARGLYGLRGFPALVPWVCFVTVWLLAEWLRSTLFTGFPWLLPGYSVQPTPLFEWSVIGGIWFTSALALATAVPMAAVTSTCLAVRSTLNARWMW